MLAFFRFLSYAFSAFTLSKPNQNLSQHLSKIVKNGDPGWLWGLLGEILEAFGPQDGPKLKNRRTRDLEDPPPGAQLGARI